MNMRLVCTDPAKDLICARLDGGNVTENQGGLNLDNPIAVSWTAPTLLQSPGRDSQ